MTTKHTPEKWEHDGFRRDNNGDWIITSESGRIGAASFKGKAKRGSAWNAPDLEGQANARLMAAAPDLLEALEEIVSRNLLLSRNAIQEDHIFCTICGVNDKTIRHIPECYVGKAEAAIRKATGEDRQ